MKLELKNIYFMDTSALVIVQRYYPISLFPDLWNNLDKLFWNERIISHDFVYDEIVPSTGAKDEIAKLVSRYKKYFKKISKRQAQLVPEIIGLFPALIDPKSKKNEADPWLISLVFEEMELKGILEMNLNMLLSVMKARKTQIKYLQFVNTII